MTTNLTDAGRARGRLIGNAKQAEQAVADNLDLLADLFSLRAHGATLRDCAASLNGRGVKTRRGKNWTQVQIKRLLDRVEGRVEFVIQKLNGVDFIDCSRGFKTYEAAERAVKKNNLSRQHRIEVYVNEGK
jgi:hypothetical protein